MTKPKVTTNPVANQYASTDERIIEYSNGMGVGGLIGLRNLEDGTMRVELYRHDDTVEIRSSSEPAAIPGDLRLSFTPNAIREHFESDEVDPTEGLTDEQLVEVGRLALTDDRVYRAFHEALVWAVENSDAVKENG